MPPMQVVFSRGLRDSRMPYGTYVARPWPPLAMIALPHDAIVPVRAPAPAVPHAGHLPQHRGHVRGGLAQEVSAQPPWSNVTMVEGVRAMEPTNMAAPPASPSTVRSYAVR